METCGGGNNKTSRLEIGIQVTCNCTLQNQDPVLNECAARLGVSLRQTEDQLTRDMLASTASFINCTGGVNGDVPTEITRSDVNTVVQALLGNNAYTIMDRMIVHVKLFLIDLESLVTGNKGQAKAA